MKPIGGKNYGSIPHLSTSKLGEGDHYVHEGQERILTVKKRDKHDNILVFEKYDGSNVGIAKVNGKLFALTRSGYEAKTSPYSQHHLFSEWVYAREKYFMEVLADGERLAGEWLLQSHGIGYEITGEPIVFFDLFRGTRRAKYADLGGLAIKYNLPLPRQLHEGDSISVEQLLPILNEKSQTIRSVENPEGMVYRVERKGQVDFLAKWVRNDFPTGQHIVNGELELVWNKINRIS